MFAVIQQNSARIVIRAKTSKSSANVCALIKSQIRFVYVFCITAILKTLNRFLKVFLLFFIDPI